MRRPNYISVMAGISAVIGMLLFFLFAAVSGFSLQTDTNDQQHIFQSLLSIEDIPVSVRVFFRALPDKAPGSDNDTHEQIELGRKLYFERGISLNNTQSCNDCHQLENNRPGADNLPISVGALDVNGIRNSPTVINAGFMKMQLWDGRAADLVEQAKIPLLNPAEMAMETEENVENYLKSRLDYVTAFGSAFPDEMEPITFDNTARAIAAFERTLIAPSRFDLYLKGQTDILTTEEKNGLQRFIHMHCIECHSYIPVGGRLLKKLGVYHPYENETDLGRYEVTHQEKDKFVFKTSMLRNVTRTPPYFHDGRVTKLTEAVRQMAWLQLDMEISSSEINEIIFFLKTLEGKLPFDINEPNLP